MTRVQIEYAKLQEERRKNKAAEALTQMRDTHAATARYMEIGETGRHNLATERQAGQVLGETTRHNVAMEGETGRHNRAEEAVHQSQAESASRQATASLQQAAASASQADTARRRQEEEVRHNLVYESQQDRALTETERSHRVQEAETERSHKASEGIAAQQISLGYSQLAESSRHNKAQEGLQQQQITESVRHNMSQETIDLTRANWDKVVKREQLHETERHNRSQERLKSREIRVDEKQRAIQSGVKLIDSLIPF